MDIAPRDVYMKHGGIWMVNAKARKSAEVNIRTLSEEDRKEFAGKEAVLMSPENSFMRFLTVSAQSKFLPKHERVGASRSRFVKRGSS